MTGTTGNDGNPFTLILSSQFGTMTSQTVAALQWKLNADGGYGLATDGIYGPLTSGALELHLGLAGNKTLYPGNGVASNEVRTLQRWIVNVGGFPCVVDGYWGPKTTTSLQESLNSTRF